MNQSIAMCALANILTKGNNTIVIPPQNDWACTITGWTCDSAVPTTPICDWQHVVCHGQRVTEIQIIFDYNPSTPRACVNGQLPTEIGLLTSLQRFELMLQYFTGTVPTEIGLLQRLTYISLVPCVGGGGTLPSQLGQLTSLQYLQFGFCSLTGPIPAELNQLTNLRLLDFSRNYMNGTFPFTSNFSSLEYFNLQSNSLVGSLTNFSPLPSSNLTYLHLGGNRGLSGVLPNDFFSIAHQLRYIDLTDTKLHGRIFDQFVQLRSLENINLFQSKFSGTIPTSIGLLTALTLIELGFNSFNGGIPSEIGNCLLLTKFQIRYNGFTGSIPSTLGYLTQLEALQFSFNKMNSTIPSELAVLTKLSILDLEANLFTSSIPYQLCALTNLQSFALCLSSHSTLGCSKITQVPKCLESFGIGALPTYDSPTRSPTSSAPTMLSIAVTSDTTTNNSLGLMIGVIITVVICVVGVVSAIVLTYLRRRARTPAMVEQDDARFDHILDEGSVVSNPSTISTKSYIPGRGSSWHSFMSGPGPRFETTEQAAINEDVVQ